MAVADCPYDERHYRRPDPRTTAQARGFQIAGWELVDVQRLGQVKGEPAGGHPVVIGMRPNCWPSADDRGLRQETADGAIASHAATFEAFANSLPAGQTETSTDRESNRTYHLMQLVKVARPAGFEPATCDLEDRCSIRLS